MCCMTAIQLLTLRASHAVTSTEVMLVTVHRCPRNPLPGSAP
jgi:hypothetical protein